MNNAIKLAIEKGGWNQLNALGVFKGIDATVLDPLFWQALGKALGWEKLGHAVFHSFSVPGQWEDKNLIPYPVYHALRYHELALTGGDTKKFWKELLTSQ